MQKSRRYSGPLPNPRFAQQVSDIVMPPFLGGVGGDITADAANNMLGVARYPGAITEVFFSLGASGKDDTNPLSMTVDVNINGTTIFTTQPVIAHTSGESSEHRTTVPEAEDDGVTEAVIDVDANEFAAGDVITFDIDITRTASPTTEISNLGIIVECRPLI
jgi:hypothetical protein